MGDLESLKEGLINKMSAEALRIFLDYYLITKTVLKFSVRVSHGNRIPHQFFRGLTSCGY